MQAAIWVKFFFFPVEIIICNFSTGIPRCDVQDIESDSHPGRREPPYHILLGLEIAIPHWHNRVTFDETVRERLPPGP